MCQRIKNKILFFLLSLLAASDFMISVLPYFSCEHFFQPNIPPINFCIGMVGTTTGELSMNNAFTLSKKKESSYQSKVVTERMIERSICFFSLLLYAMLLLTCLRDEPSINPEIHIKKKMRSCLFRASIFGLIFIGTVIKFVVAVHNNRLLTFNKVSFWQLTYYLNFPLLFCILLFFCQQIYSLITERSSI
ncbi:uncharacterized protein LOC100200230 isoform X1 [Hydra vulgaris]|uniref:uncharacterized protein LOC100200230 isoform X1 n=1 Tax=Hydra vulgaris TaxID=6087 RepID=UPI0001923CA3|nr:uncharacterized protein LOC100200230 isoform X1 [Hydra vulgaris]